MKNTVTLDLEVYEALKKRVQALEEKYRLLKNKDTVGLMTLNGLYHTTETYIKKEHLPDYLKDFDCKIKSMGAEIERLNKELRAKSKQHKKRFWIF
jgi:hypothetical protein